MWQSRWTCFQNLGHEAKRSSTADQCGLSLFKGEQGRASSSANNSSNKSRGRNGEKDLAWRW